MTTTTELLSRQCRHLEDALSEAETKAYLAAIDGWSIENGKLTKTFGFANYYETMAFVNAIAYVFHAEDHHPELVVTYNRCVIRLDTHSVNGGQGGISENDFICAAKVDAIFRQGSH